MTSLCSSLRCPELILAGPLAIALCHEFIGRYPDNLRTKGPDRTFAGIGGANANEAPHDHGIDLRIGACRHDDSARARVRAGAPQDDSSGGLAKLREACRADAGACARRSSPFNLSWARETI